MMCLLFSSVLSDFNFYLSLSQNSSAMIKATDFIIDAFYKYYTTSIFIVTNAISSENREKHLELITQIVQDQNGSMCFAIEELRAVNDRFFKRYFAFFVVDRYESFQWALRANELKTAKMIS